LLLLPVRADDAIDRLRLLIIRFGSNDSHCMSLFCLLELEVVVVAHLSPDLC